MTLRIRHMLLAACFTLSCLAVGAPLAAEATSAGGEPGGDRLRLGERMYRDGILPDGNPLRGYVRGDMEIDSTAFSCANCHTRSGLGSVEGQVVSPPVNGASLFKPRFLLKDQVKNTISRQKGVLRKAPQTRPAYTDASLAHALRGGVNPDGRPLLPIMPRYNLNDRDMQIMIDYLHALSAEHSPGVTDKELHLATIVTDDVSAADRAAMRGILDTLVKINHQTTEQRKHRQFFKMFRMLDIAYFRHITIDTWELTGAPETWPAQLKNHYDRKPVFAILGGISSQPWQPIHDFCETNKIPCLLPITDLPVISQTSWYTLYASKGYVQEGDTAARFLTGSNNPGKIVQLVVASPPAKALASGFDQARQELGAEAVTTVTLSPGDLQISALRKLLQQHRPDTLLVWTGTEALPLLASLAEEGSLPNLFLSARMLGTKIGSVPERLRDKAFITYPFRLPEEEKRYAGYAEVLHLDKQKKDDQRIASRTFSMVHVFLQGLKELKLDFYRDTLLDQIAMLPDQYLPDFERYSFGPGQRYASKGCYIVQLGPGSEPQLIKKSEWVIY